MTPAAAALCATLASAAAALAQQDQGTIAGLVTDGSASVVARAAVTATAVNGASVLTTTNVEGHYVLSPLVVGRYVVTVEVAGFKRAVSAPIDVHASARVRLDVQLELGPVADAIVVRPPAALLQTDTSSLGQTVGDSRIGGLPVNGRNFQQLAMLAAGVLPAFGHFDQQAGFNSNGQWALQNNFILDGVDNNSHVMALQDRKAQVLVPNLDAVQEFRIHTSNYSAEFGRGAGAVMNVTIKSGTNTVRGTAHHYHRNDAFDARDAFDYYDRTGDGKADPDALRQHQFGVTLGGPIRRSRTFYFGSVEATRVRTTGNSLVTVPTAAERLGIFDPRTVTLRDPATGLPFADNAIPAERWDRVAARLIRLWPEPNFAGTTRANYVSSPAHERRRAQYDVRVDHTFSSRDRMFVRASRMDYTGERQGSFATPAVGSATNDESRDDNTAFNVAVSATRVLGAAVVHEVRVGINRLRTNKQPLTRGFPNQEFGLRVDAPDPVEGLSRLSFGGLFGYASLGEGLANPNDKAAGTLQFLDNLSIAIGTHTLKAGADLRWIHSRIDGAVQARGVFAFNGRFTGSALGDFLLGMTSSRQFSTMLRGDFRERDYMFYVQDDWRVARHLTINVGLRYELASPKFEVQDRLATLDPAAFPEVRLVRAGERGRSWSDRALVRTDTNNWAPRIGAAFQPAPRWTVSAAAGVFYGTPRAVGPAVHLLNNWPHARAVTVPSTRTRSAGQLADGMDRDLLGSGTEMPADLSWNVWSADFTSPTIAQWNVSVQRQLGEAWAVTTAYVGSSSAHLQRLVNINAAPPGDGSTERERRMIPSIGAITLTESTGRASYRGLQTTVEKRFSHGTQGALSYTWSRSVDDVTEALGGEGSMVVQDWRHQAGDRGNSGFDRRHRLVAHALVDLPFGGGRRWVTGGLAAALLGGWQLSAIVSAQSGGWFDVTILDPANRLGVTPGTSVWRPDLVGDPRMPRPTADAWMNAGAFAVPQNADGTYRFGNLGRNTLLGPGYLTIDAGLTREVRLGGTRRLQLRWEVFNVTNHPSFGFPNATLGSADFGTIRTTLSAPRQMQFGLKYVF